jgi:cytochrome c551/c552
VQISSQSNIAAKFDHMPGAATPQAASLMPTGAGHAGNLPVHPLPAGNDEELQRLMNG